jgi:hypothetical protein
MLLPQQGAIKSDFMTTILWTPEFSSVLGLNVPISSGGASFVYSPEKGIGESCNCFVVRTGAASKFPQTANKVKTKQRENNFRGALRKIFEHRRCRRDPLPALNISAFFSDGWRHTLSRHEGARLYS